MRRGLDLCEPDSFLLGDCFQSTVKWLVTNDQTRALNLRKRGMLICFHGCKNRTGCSFVSFVDLNMVQQSLIYSFVARGTVILAEHTDFGGNFTEVALECLRRLPASNTKFTYNADGHTFNYLTNNGFTFCVVAVESVGRQLAMAFLERINEDFTKRYGGGKATTATPKSLTKEFGPKLKEHMQYCVEHPEEVSKLAKVKAQVSEVQQVMRANIDQVLDRQVKIDVLLSQTEDLRDQKPYKFRCKRDVLLDNSISSRNPPHAFENVSQQSLKKHETVGRGVAYP
ncbi:unnamed protein product [Sphenostylis stenocarpa]|uniref:Uncharacterized protein n=1 Tax=Sphenostylis stenocarpa TaxID=92480 RepID=A0AA86V128_9FABA|nr:unnamed protein product [Sphenostylis stenocarpa]